MNVKQGSDNKLFWKSVKPFFSDKGSNSSKITLVEEDNIISDEEEIVNIMNNLFHKCHTNFRSLQTTRCQVRIVLALE